MSRSYNGVGKAWARFNEHGEGKGHKQDRDRISYSGYGLWSWGTVVGKYHKNSRGEPYVLITSRRYSVSSSSHISHAGGWVKVPKFSVPAIGHPGGWNNNDWFHMGTVHAFNMAHLADEFVNFCHAVELAFHQDAPPELKASQRGWMLEDGRWQESLRQLDARIWSYAEICETPLPADRRPVGEILEDVAARRQARYAAFYNPDAVYKRARSRAKRLAIKALGLNAKR